LGDSYRASGGDYKNGSQGVTSIVGHTSPESCPETGRMARAKASGLKPKDLIGIPWRVAFALQQPYYTGKIRNEADRIWLAAMIDGEGCFFIHKRKAGTPSYSKFTRTDGSEVNYERTADTYGVGLEICNTNKAIIDRIAAIVGGGTFTEQNPQQNNRRKQTIYRWRVAPNEAKRIAQEIYPHLIAKQHQARLLFACPSNGDNGAAAHQAMMDLHNGIETSVDYPAPPSMFEPGWYLRQDCIWSKPNCMPESVTDRCTKAHEYIFLLTKSAKYFYDAEAVKEPSTEKNRQSRIDRAIDGQKSYPTEKQNGIRSRADSFKREGSKREQVIPFQTKGTHRPDREESNYPLDTRNRRSVWTITTKPFKSVFSYGKYRIASPDCPVHDYHADLGRALECDALLASSQIDRMMNNGIHPFPLQEGVVVSIPLDHPLFPFDGISAIPHSMRNYRTADELKQDEIFFGISPYRTEYKELIDHSISKCVRTRGSNTEVDVFQGVSGTYPSGQTRYRIFCILTWQSPPSGCLCHYTGDLKKGQDHFAVFPPELPDICIKAGTSEKGCCPECGSPWVRTLIKPDDRQYEYKSIGIPGEGEQRGRRPGSMGKSQSISTGWRTACNHNLDPVPCTVCDPFSGAGTTGLVAEKLGRKYIGIELNPAYVKMAKQRIESELGTLF
jgi:hypothetical protein